ncbi:hypothetical protein PENANT_c102G05368 [Penicillium antarcticum]|uniref:Uncharacterized protein n=1 Tax=Penicillium antarcticum TaxID=416450 RepID=A0A1V6PLM6_9EURO|nr:hypothetical protein PENANT_c102G05368 [Penicillium antarcticum]
MTSSFLESKLIRYSNTLKLTEYYQSVFLKLNGASRQKILEALERPKLASNVPKQGETYNVHDNAQKHANLSRKPKVKRGGSRGSKKQLNNAPITEASQLVKRCEKRYEDGYFDSNNFGEYTVRILC